MAYKEDTSVLEKAFREEGFQPQVSRPEYSELEMTYSRSIRCLLNHMSAWEKARTRPGYTIIVEADFAPCRSFGAMPVPFNPADHGGNAWAFLYSASPRFFERLADGTTPGHSSCPVAYVVSPRVAGYLCQYGREELARHGDLTQYSLWDTQILWHIMGMGGICFMARRQFGEHGGNPNKEHRKAMTGLLMRVPFIDRLEIGQNHHADVLNAPMKFLPIYSGGHRRRVWLRRLEAKSIAFVRLFTGKTVAPQRPMGFSEKFGLYAYSFLRLLWPY